MLYANIICIGHFFLPQALFVMLVTYLSSNMALLSKINTKVSLELKRQLRKTSRRYYFHLTVEVARLRSLPATEPAARDLCSIISDKTLKTKYVKKNILLKLHNPVQSFEILQNPFVICFTS